MSRYLAVMVCLILLSPVPGFSAEKKQAGPALAAEKKEVGKKEAVFTQRDLGKMIVAQFGWGDGLPKEPTDRDYLVILGGKRTFRYEAETAYNLKTDNVTVRSFNLFGPFTGKGWLNGVSDKTEANFKVLLPIAGDYSFRGVMKGQGFTWKLGDKDYPGSTAGGIFTEVELAKLVLKPGTLQIKVAIPPEGAIDSFVFIAKDYNPVQPFGGWRFSEPLSALRLAEVGISLMNGYDRLPLAAPANLKQVSAIDVAVPHRDVEPSTINYLGTFSSSSWLRANFRGATISMPLKVDQAGFYIVRVQALGEQLSGDLNGVAFAVKGKAYLDMTELGLFRLEAGDNVLNLKVPPMGGVDRVELQPKSLLPSEVMVLAGVSGNPERLIKADEAVAFLKSIREKYPVRK